MSEMTFEKLIAQYGPTIAYLSDEKVNPDITMTEFANMLTEGGAIFVSSPVTAELGEEMQAAATYLADAAELPDGSPELPRLLKRAGDHLDVVKVLA